MEAAFCAHYLLPSKLAASQESCEVPSSDLYRVWPVLTQDTNVSGQFGEISLPGGERDVKAAYLYLQCVHSHPNGSAGSCCSEERRHWPSSKDAP